MTVLLVLGYLLITGGWMSIGSTARICRWMVIAGQVAMLLPVVVILAMYDWDWDALWVAFTAFGFLEKAVVAVGLIAAAVSPFYTAFALITLRRKAKSSYGYYS